MVTTRWGIIGCGNVTEVKSGPGFSKAAGSELVAVMRRNAQAAEDYARRHGVPRWYSDADALIADRDVDVVYIATPVSTHMEYALKVCQAGKRAYVEKPMARSARECRTMVEAFRSAGLDLFVAYYRRALPRFVKAKELIDTGRLGRVTSISYRHASAVLNPTEPGKLPWRYQAEHSGGGLFMDIGSHTLDALDFMLGPIQDVSGEAVNLAGRYEVEDGVAMQFRLASGALGTACWNCASAIREDMIQISGTEGRLRMSTFGNEPVQLETAGGVEQFDLPNPPHVQQPLIQTIVDQLAGSGRCPSTGESALRTAVVMDRVLEGYYGRRDDEYWRRPATWPGRQK